MKKYVKVMFGTTSGAKSDFKYKLNEEEFQKFATKKNGMFKWYKSLNKFLKEVDKL